MSDPYRELEKKIGYRFRKRSLLETALTHRSYRFETKGASADNQRLEFLGDAVLNLLAAEHLYLKEPSAQEGVLTKRRSRATNTRALMSIAEQWELARVMRMGRGEMNSVAIRRSTTLPDAVEAILGAVYLDGGLKKARKVFEHWFSSVIESAHTADWMDNPKGALQEYVQQQNRISPHYHLLKTEGPPHERVFTCEVRVGNEVWGVGTGHTKREAESAAALEALRRMGANLVRKEDLEVLNSNSLNGPVQ